MKNINAAVALALILLFIVAAYSPAHAGRPSANVVPGRFIVVLDYSVSSPEDIAREMAVLHGVVPVHFYHTALKGFSAYIPTHKLRAVAGHPSVTLVEHDLVVNAIKRQRSGSKVAKGAVTTEVQPPQELPPGIDRVDAEQNLTPRPVDVDIAIIDTGVSSTHPDLNFFLGMTVAGAGTAGGEDDNGHGSHVAGSAAAIDNGIGVVGVAPGARLWSAKVLDSNGSGSMSAVIAGIDWVTENAAEIEVANMSLGSIGRSDALRTAIQNSTAAGIFYAVAAGNDAMAVYGDDHTFNTSDDSIPAAYPEVTTVSAIADTDGQGGWLGPPSMRGQVDDTFSSFSNFGAAVDIAAPGVDIYSTWLGGTYNTMSGTSMSSPHVAGAAALYLSKNPGTSPDRVQHILISTGTAQSDHSNGFTGDPDPSPEPLLNASNL